MANELNSCPKKNYKLPVSTLKKNSTSLIIKEIQIEKTWRFYLASFRMVVIMETTNARENVERAMRESLFVPGGNVN